MILADGSRRPLKGGAVNLDDAATTQADQVRVLLLFVQLVVVLLPLKVKLAHRAGLLEGTEGAVNGGEA